MAKDVIEFANLSAGKKSVVNRIKVSNNGTLLGDAARAKAKTLANRNGEAAVWRQGDSFIVPSEGELNASFFAQPMDDAGEVFACGVAVDLVGGGSKALYLSTLKKSAVEYHKEGEEFIAGAVHASDTALAKEALQAGTQEELLDMLIGHAGDTVSVQKVDSFMTARWKDNVPVGLRRTTVPYFEVTTRAARGEA